MKNFWRRIVRWFRSLPPWVEITILAGLAVGLLILGTLFIWASFVPIPSIDNFQNRKVAESTKIYDRTGNVVLYDVHGTMRRTAVPLDQISPYVQRATIAIEDAEFYNHHGFRPLSFARAVWADITTGSFGQGGSTITQQVVKNALLTQDKTPIRKLKEIILALKLERIYSKDQILNTYLNENPYGGTIYGIQEASQYFFGVDASQVDLAQAAYLAALPQAPTYYSPYGNHRAALDQRKNLVLSRMKDIGFISNEEYESAKAEDVQFKSETEAGIKAPHFVFFIREYLESKYGVDAVHSGGLRVITTLDFDLQQKAEQVVTKWAPQMERNFNASNESVVAIDPKTGQILAMIGSRGYFDETIDGKVNVATSNRQPGSSFKPFVYATALERGYTDDTVVFDLPTQFSTACSPQDNTNSNPPCYSPGNYDGTFKGPITMRNALAISENVPAVKFLYLAGIEEAIETARDMGITTLVDAARYGLTLVLGGGEVNLLEMTGAYGVFANDGVKNAPTGVLAVTDNVGNIIEEYEAEPERVIEQQIARTMNDMLSDNVARTPEFGANSPLYFPGYDVADKTGTTNDFRDVWIIGYTPSIAVGAWAGNNDNSPMERRIAAFIIAPMWHEFMDYALEKYSSQSDAFPAPAPDPDLANLPPVLRGEWNADPSQGVHDILFWVQKNNPRGGRPSNPWADSQAAYWDYPVQLWAANNGQMPTSTTPGGSGGFSISAPQTGAQVAFNSTITITANASDAATIANVSYFANGSLIGSSGVPPYSVSYTTGTRGVVTLRATALHMDGATEESTIAITVQ